MSDVTTLEVRMAWVARGRCGHIIAAHASDSEASRRWVAEGMAPHVTYEVVPSQQVRDEGFCPGHTSGDSPATPTLLAEKEPA